MIKKTTIIAILLTARVALCCTIDIGTVGVYAGESFNYGRNVSINSSIVAENSISGNNNATINGNLYSNNSIWLASRTSVYGDVTMPTGRPFYGYGTTIKGSILNDKYSFDSSAFLSPTETLIGTESIYAAKNKTTNISAGLYKDLNAEKNSVLNMTAGEYNFSSLWLDKDSVVNLDTSAGDVVINVFGSTSTSSNISFNTTGSGTLKINVFNADAWFGNDTTLAATLSVYNGSIGVDSDSTLGGSLYASKNIWLADSVQFDYIAAASIPEPSSVFILAAGGLCWLFRRTRTGCSPR